MFYESGRNHSSFQDQSFVPMFEASFSSDAEEQAAQALCGCNKQCLLDYAATKNKEMSRATLESSQSINVANRLFSTYK